MKSGGGMKKIIRFSFYLTILIVLLIGCGNEQLDTRQYIMVEQLQQDQTTYKEINKVTSEIDVEKVKEMLLEASWGKSNIELAGKADYRLYFQFFDKNIEAKAVVYEFWEDEVNSRFHVTRGNEMYMYLSQEETSVLLSIMNSKAVLEVGNSLTNQTQIIDDLVVVEQIESIIQKANWEQAKVQKVREEDYRMNIRGETIRLWITPNGKQFELVKTEHYSKLNEKDSEVILKALEN